MNDGEIVMMDAKEPGAAYRRFLRDVKRIQKPYLSPAWMIEYNAALECADISPFAKLPLLAFPLNPDFIQVPGPRDYMLQFEKLSYSFDLPKWPTFQF